jgi:hypothetical protein
MGRCRIGTVILLPHAMLAFALTMDTIGIWIVRAVILAIYIETLVQVYRDAKSRGKDPFTVALCCALCGWPASCILWYVFRPEAPSVRLEEATECIQCRSTIPAGETACPKCGWSYRQ